LKYPFALSLSKGIFVVRQAHHERKLTHYPILAPDAGMVPASALPIFRALPTQVEVTKDPFSSFFQEVSQGSLVVRLPQLLEDGIRELPVKDVEYGLKVYQKTDGAYAVAYAKGDVGSVGIPIPSDATKVGITAHTHPPDESLCPDRSRFCVYIPGVFSFRGITIHGIRNGDIGNFMTLDEKISLLKTTDKIWMLAKPEGWKRPEKAVIDQVARNYLRLLKWSSEQEISAERRRIERNALVNAARDLGLYLYISPQGQTDFVLQKTKP